MKKFLFILPLLSVQPVFAENITCPAVENITCKPFPDQKIGDQNYKTYTCEYNFNLGDKSITMQGGGVFSQESSFSNQAIPDAFLAHFTNEGPQRYTPPILPPFSYSLSCTYFYKSGSLGLVYLGFSTEESLYNSNKPYELLPWLPSPLVDPEVNGLERHHYYCGFGGLYNDVRPLCILSNGIKIDKNLSKPKAIK